MGLFRRRQEPDVVIDLTVADQRPPAPKLVWGLPSPCPACSDPGYLDRIDPVNEVMFQHCPSCFHKWETGRAELEAADVSA